MLKCGLTTLALTWLIYPITTSSSVPHVPIVVWHWLLPQEEAGTSSSLVLLQSLVDLSPNNGGAPTHLAL